MAKAFVFVIVFVFFIRMAFLSPSGEPEGGFGLGLGLVGGAFSLYFFAAYHFFCIFAHRLQINNN